VMAAAILAVGVEHQQGHLAAARRQGGDADIQPGEGVK
jgi:hypothetical protein